MTMIFPWILKESLQSIQNEGRLLTGTQHAEETYWSPFHITRTSPKVKGTPGQLEKIMLRGHVAKLLTTLMALMRSRILQRADEVADCTRVMRSGENARPKHPEISHVVDLESF